MTKMLSKNIFLQLLAILLFSSFSFANICDTIECAREAKPYADLSRLVYTKGQEGNGWELVRNNGKIVDFELDFGCYHDIIINNYVNCVLSGYYAALYHKTGTDEYVLAFRGTNGLNDWGVNLNQYIGLTNFISFSDQHDKAVRSVDSVQDLLPSNAKLTLTGHSLGGGLATWAAHKRGLKAYVFNTARISYISKKFLPNTSGCYVKSYISCDGSIEWCDVVSGFGEGTALTTDYVILIPDDWGDFYPPLQLHSIDLINNALIFFLIPQKQQNRLLLRPNLLNLGKKITFPLPAALRSFKVSGG